MSHKYPRRSALPVFGLAVFLGAQTVSFAWLLPCSRSLGGLAFAGESRPSERDRWQMPEEVVSALSLKNGQVVADIGAGSGYFTMRFARAVGPQGRVYAVDVAPNVLDFIQKQARKQNLDNVEVIVSRQDDPLLPAGSVDVAFFCETIHEMDDRVPFYRKVREAMKRAGRMVLIDSIPPAGKPVEGRQVSRAVALREAEAAGFRLIREETFLPRQYFLVFGKKGGR